MDENRTARWQALQRLAQECRACASMEGVLFSRFLYDWPEIPEPGFRVILFISEAPPPDGGFWTIQRCGKRQDNLRQKLLPLVGLETAGDDRGLGRFVRAGFFLLQAFQRPLNISIAGIKQDELLRILRHSVDAHVAPAVRLVAPRGVIALGRPAAAVVSEIFPRSDFAQAYNGGGLDAVQGRLFRGESPIPLGASFLPSGAGRFRRDRWTRQIPELVAAIDNE